MNAIAVFFIALAVGGTLALTAHMLGENAGALGVVWVAYFLVCLMVSGALFMLDTSQFVVLLCYVGVILITFAGGSGITLEMPTLAQPSSVLRAVAAAVATAGPGLTMLLHVWLVKMRSPAPQDD